jgi:hypothetical protein
MESRSKSTDFDIRHRFRCKSSLRLDHKTRDQRGMLASPNFEEWKRGLFVECELARGPDVAKSE